MNSDKIANIEQFANHAFELLRMVGKISSEFNIMLLLVLTTRVSRVGHGVFEGWCVSVNKSYQFEVLKSEWHGRLKMLALGRKSRRMEFRRRSGEVKCVLRSDEDTSMGGLEWSWRVLMLCAWFLIWPGCWFKFDLSNHSMLHLQLLTALPDAIRHLEKDIVMHSSYLLKIWFPKYFTSGFARASVSWMPRRCEV